MATEPAAPALQADVNRSRRRWLGAALASLASGAADASSTLQAIGQRVPASSPLFISGARRGDARFAAIVFDEFGSTLATIALEARAHGAASHAGSHRACLFARRPGLFLHAFDRRSPQATQLVRPIQGRHFYGHGCYSADGRLLFATENDFDEQRGVLGVYEADNGYRRAGEIVTGGIGPHEVLRIPGTSLLVVANGGILTHPDSDRDKLNIDTMAPSIVVIDARDGRLQSRHALPDDWHQVSLRHLAVDADGDIWFAGQYEGELPTVQGLIGRLTLAGVQGQSRARQPGLVLTDVPEALQQRMGHYVSSVAVCGDQVLFTAARGGLVLIVDRTSGRLRETVSVRDCSGVCAAWPDTALLTSGTGEILNLSDAQLQSVGMQAWHWDNHVYTI